MSSFDAWLKVHFRKVYGLLILAALAMYGVFSLETFVWADEAYTFALLEHSFSDIWKITAADVHPPLYYFFLKVLTAPFGYHLAVCRMVSALPCVLLIAVGGWQFQRLFGERTAVLFMALYLFYPYSMTYSTEVRMYSLAALLILLNAIWAYRCWLWNRKRDWVVYALAGTAAALTHYFALVSAAMVYGLLLLAAIVKKRQLLKGWLLASGATILMYLPWLGSFVSQLVYKVNNPYWIEPITIGTLVGYVQALFGANGLGAFPLYFAAAYAAAFLVVLLSRKKEGILLSLAALAVPLGTIALGLAASVLVRPVFVIRYLLPSIPLMVFFLAYALGKCSSTVLVTSLLTVALMGGSSNCLVKAVGTLRPDMTCIRKEVVRSLPECDGYVVLSGNTMHASQELSYCDPVTPIYTVDALGADNPYPNRFSYSSFQLENHEGIILVLAAGEAIPENLQSHYEGTYLQSLDVSGTPQDLWYLIRK